MKIIEKDIFARICIGVDLKKGFLFMFTIADENFLIKYKGLYLIYSMCGKYGHHQETCPSLINNTMREEQCSRSNNQSATLVKHVKGRQIVLKDEAFGSQVRVQ